jgi:hypothetical protein
MLAETQQLFSNALFDAAEEQQVQLLFKDDAQVMERRFALYRGNLTSAWEKTLSAAYPVLKALVGDEFFEALARAYGKACPSQTGDLNLFGDRLADFLENFPHVAEYPYFPDMARLEWALHRAHYADDAAAFDPSEIAQLAPEQLDNVRLILHPAATLVESKWAVVELWLAHLPERANDFPEEIEHHNHAVIARPHWKAVVLPVQPAAYAALHALQNGQTLGAALDAALKIDEGFDFGSHLQQWLQHALFSKVA